MHVRDLILVAIVVIFVVAVGGAWLGYEGSQQAESVQQTEDAGS